MSDNVIHPPWDDEQVRHLNNWQTNRYGHPFTCGTCRDADMETALASGGDAWRRTPERALTATPNGWVCTGCNGTQDWAWSFMAQPHRSIWDGMRDAVLAADPNGDTPA